MRIGITKVYYGGGRRIGELILALRRLATSIAAAPATQANEGSA